MIVDLPPARSTYSSARRSHYAGQLIALVMPVSAHCPLITRRPPLPFPGHSAFSCWPWNCNRQLLTQNSRVSLPTVSLQVRAGLPVRCDRELTVAMPRTIWPVPLWHRVPLAGLGHTVTSLLDPTGTTWYQRSALNVLCHVSFDLYLRTPSSSSIKQGPHRPGPRPRPRPRPRRPRPAPGPVHSAGREHSGPARV